MNICSCIEKHEIVNAILRSTNVLELKYSRYVRTGSVLLRLVDTAYKDMVLEYTLCILSSVNAVMQCMLAKHADTFIPRNTWLCHH